MDTKNTQRTQVREAQAQITNYELRIVGDCYLRLNLIFSPNNLSRQRRHKEHNIQLNPDSALGKIH